METNQPSESIPTSISVGALNRAVAGVLARGFPIVRVHGEVANFTRAASGHWYFTLKDEGAQVRCVMFRGRNALVGFVPREGDALELTAQVTLYEARGEYQLNVESAQRFGLGRLFEEFLRLKAQLAAQGVFEEARKRALPRLPQRIGVITSLQAAALRDVLSALQRRAPYVRVIVYPVLVQGAGAGQQIADMLARVSERAEVDVALLVRGGGSIEDLWAFNEAVVAHAVRACRVPVVVGVGHESDFTIADFAADVRAPTPTAAAELVAPERDALLAAINAFAVRGLRHLVHRMERAAQRLDYAQRLLKTPRAALQARFERLAQLQSHAARALLANRLRDGERLARAQQRLQLRMPQIGVERLRLSALQKALRVACERRREFLRHRLAEASGHLRAIDPEQVLRRGYAIAFNAKGLPVTQANTVHVGDVLHLQFAQGAADAQVIASREADRRSD